MYHVSLLPPVKWFIIHAVKLGLFICLLLGCPSVSLSAPFFHALLLCGTACPSSRGVSLLLKLVGHAILHRHHPPLRLLPTGDKVTKHVFLVFISFPIFNHQMCERSRPQACLNNWTSVQYSTIALSYSMHKTCPGSRKHRERKRKGAICNWMYFLLQ